MTCKKKSKFALTTHATFEWTQVDYAVERARLEALFGGGAGGKL